VRQHTSLNKADACNGGRRHGLALVDGRYVALIDAAEGEPKKRGPYKKL
jgi:hypothetical protein